MNNVYSTIDKPWVTYKSKRNATYPCVSPLQSRIVFVFLVVGTAEDRYFRLILHPGLSQSDVVLQDEPVVFLAVYAGIARLGSVGLVLDLIECGKRLETWRDELNYVEK